MKKAQKVVALGALSGVASMLVLVTFIFKATPPPSGNMQSYVLCCLALSVVPLFVMLATVGNKRFLSKAINPLAHAESEAMEIDAHVIDNTLQQNFVFVVATSTLASQLPFMYLKVVFALSLTFVVARFAFWYGYRKSPLLRAPGMAATAYMNLFILLGVLYFVLF